MSFSVDYYPKPGPVGGRIIRNVIQLIKSQRVALPLTSDILIATSGGSDSVALAHLLVHYGRRIVPKDRVTLIHYNHRWRAEESDQDEAFVKALADSWGVPFLSERAQALPAGESGQSWEEEARLLRKKFFEKEALSRGAMIFTAHHADDLAETLLWRLFTGASQTHGGGVAFHSGVEMRPFLKLRKNQIQEYLKEADQSYREDSSNQMLRFMRAKMRSSLMKEIDLLFPNAVQHLVNLGLSAQAQAQDTMQDRASENNAFSEFFRAAGIKPRRPYFEKAQMRAAEAHLPEGWKLQHSQHKSGEKWTLSKEVSKALLESTSE